MPALKALFAPLGNWLFRWRSEGTAPIVLHQRRVFILPTRAGLLFALALVVMLLCAINYELGLGHALVFLLAGIGLSGMVHTFRNLAWLSITPGRADPVFAGEMAHFPLHLGHDRHQARLALEFNAGDNPTVRCDVPPAGTVSIGLPVLAQRRGWLELPRVRLASRYPLGFFVAWSYPQPAMRCLVYPKPFLLPLPPATPVPVSGTRQGDGGQDDFAGLRERQPSDSPRHIAWKAVARNSSERPLLVKQFTGGAQNELQLDWHLLPPGMDAETCLSALAGWVLAADAAGLRYGLKLPGCEISSADGPRQRQRCLEQLALAMP